MKQIRRFFSVVLALLLLSSGIVFSYEADDLKTATAPAFPETYLGGLSKPFSRAMTFEDFLVYMWVNVIPAGNPSSFTLSEEEFLSEYFGILSEHPLLYHAGTGIRYNVNETTGYVDYVQPIYTETDKTVISETIKKIEVAAEEILLLINDDMTDFEKVMTVHNYMVLEYEYDHTYSNYDITIMLTKTGVCQAYSYAFKHLMNVLNIPCLFVPSETMDHGWNLVNLDGSWYHIDLTWDDLSDDSFAQVASTFALLSDAKIQSLASPHYAYDTKGVKADSDLYDNAVWHLSTAEVTSFHGTSYWVEGNSLVSSKGEVIFSALDEDSKGWLLGNGYVFKNAVLAGVAEHNDMIYFNSDRAIYSFNPKKDSAPVKIKEVIGVCGLYVDKNTLKYNRFDRQEEVRDEETNELLGYRNFFVPNGEIKLSNTRFGSPRYENGKLVVRVYKEDDEPLLIYSFSDVIDLKTVAHSKLGKAEFSAEDEQTIFFWDENMQPLIEQKEYKSD